VPNVRIVDYGVGNLLSLKFALEKVGLNVSIATPEQDLKRADAVALPGVGNFSAAAAALSLMKETLKETVEAGTPVLGICLGMQLFFESSEEGPGEGLAFFGGKNVRLRGSAKVPHMGWNSLNITKSSELFCGIDEGTYVYFVHSLYPVPVDTAVVCTLTNYGETFASAVASGNIYGTQFHPEKSGDVGLRILKNFERIISR
jgi:glutamine amidotransferase